MRSTGFSRLLRVLPLLTRQQGVELAAALQPALGLDSVCAAIDSGRIVSPERFLRAAIGIFHTQ